MIRQLRPLLKHPVNGLKNVPSSAVIGGDRQREACVLRRQRFSIADKIDNLWLELRQITDNLEANSILMQFAHLLFQYMHEELHQECDLVRRPAPIFATERKQGEIFNAAVHARPDRSANRFDAALVASHAWQESFFCPPSVAIHDDGNVPGNQACFRYFSS